MKGKRPGARLSLSKSVVYSRLREWMRIGPTHRGRRGQRLCKRLREIKISTQGKRKSWILSFRTLHYSRKSSGIRKEFDHSLLLSSRFSTFVHWFSLCSLIQSSLRKFFGPNSYCIEPLLTVEPLSLVLTRPKDLFISIFICPKDSQILWAWR